MKAAPSRKNRTAENAGVVETSGEFFADNSAIEPVCTKTGSQPQLLFWRDGRRVGIAPQIRRKGKIFVPFDVHPTVWKAMTLPNGVTNRGSSRKLFAQTTDLIEEYVGIPTADAAIATAWNASTHFADILPSPPSLLISGFDMHSAMILLKLLSCTARHPLILTEVDRNALRLLASLQATLLINQPQMSRRLRALCFSSNYRGIVLPAPQGAVLGIVSCKAIFVGMEPGWLYERGVPLNLECSRSNRPPLNAATCVRIRNHFQPWWLSHRLRNLRSVRQSRYTTSNLASAMSGLGSIFQSCTGNDADLEQQWAPRLQLLEQNAVARQCWDPRGAFVEVVWPPLHGEEKEIGVSVLTEGINDLLSSRGEIRRYTPEEIGRLLQGLEFATAKRNFGMVLVLDRATSLRIHELARKFKVCQKVAGCPDCAELPGDESAGRE